MSDKMLCPRRNEMPDPTRWLREEGDTWQDRSGKQHCSFCGSLHPDEFMRLAEAGHTLTPTDKNYKTYIKHENEKTKFYFAHLSEDQMRKFVEIHNEKKLKFHYPGYFYRFPFFMKPVGLGPTS